MTGLALAAALVQRGVSVVAYDEAPAGLEGPWATTARMETLRSPKQLAGPALGIPSLTFRAWFEAQFGRDAWEALDKIPRLQWMDYLRWYRQRAGAAGAKRPSRHRHRAAARRRCSSNWPTASRARRARSAHLGAARRPRHRPRRPRRPGLAAVRGSAAAHALGALVGRQRLRRARRPARRRRRRRRLGDGQCGDGARSRRGAACTCWCAAPTCRASTRARAPAIPASCTATRACPDEWKWRIRHYINTQQVPPPRNSTQRVSRHPNAHFHLGVAIEARRRARRRAAGAHLGRADRARLPDLRDRLQGRLAAAADAAPHRAVHPHLARPLLAGARRRRRRARGIARPRRRVRVPAARRARAARASSACTACRTRRRCRSA